MGTETYRPADVQVIFSGKPLTDFPEDTFITITPLGQGTTLQKGIKDKSAWSQDANSAHDVGLTLMQSGADNEFMSGLYAAQKAGIKGDKSLLIKDLSGNTLFESQSARIANYVEQTFGPEATNNNQWMVKCAKANRLVGGNTPT